MKYYSLSRGALAFAACIALTSCSSYETPEPAAPAQEKAMTEFFHGNTSKLYFKGMSLRNIGESREIAARGRKAYNKLIHALGTDKVDLVACSAYADASRKSCDFTTPTGIITVATETGKVTVTRGEKPVATARAKQTELTDIMNDIYARAGPGQR